MGHIYGPCRVESSVYADKQSCGRPEPHSSSLQPPVCGTLIAPGWVQVLDGTFSRPLPTARAIEAAGYDLDAVELPAAAITPQNAAAATEEAAAAAGAA